jgi:hypothetical protein
MPIALEVSCRKVSRLAAKSAQARTVNASPGGVYVETADAVTTGDLVEMEFFVPPTTGVLESGGVISGQARVVRVDAAAGGEKHSGSFARTHGLAVEFCQPPRLQM